MLTPEFLMAATGCTKQRGELFKDPLNETIRVYRVTTKRRLAPFLANVAHESEGLHWTREIWGPTDIQRGYEGRLDLGNTHEGDGSRFKGRGLIQTTGRYNYRVLTQRLKARIGDTVPDFERHPELLEVPEWAAISAGDYWDMRALNQLADNDDFIGLVRKINRGLMGLPDRRRRLVMAQAALQKYLPNLEN